MVVGRANMPDELAVGTKLVAHYKGTIYRAVIIETEDERLLKVVEIGDSKRVEPGAVFGSLSGAGRALTGAKAVGGRRFWIIDDGLAKYRHVKAERVNREKVETPTPRTRLEVKTVLAPPTERKHRQIKRYGEQGRYWCDGCAKSFRSEVEPQACPSGHGLYTDL